MSAAIATGSAEGSEPPFRVVDVPHDATSREQVIRFLVAEVVTAGQVAAADTDSIIGNLLRREELGSTAIGRGVAVPHTKSDRIQSPAAIAGRLKTPLEWQSLDGKPVHLVCLAISPSGDPSSHLRSLENVVKFLRRGGLDGV